jgi:hypothetical protein
MARCQGLVQGGVHLDVGAAAQGVGDGADLVGLLDGLLEAVGVDAGDAAVDVEDLGGDLEAPMSSTQVAFIRSSSGSLPPSWSTLASAIA